MSLGTSLLFLAALSQVTQGFPSLALRQSVTAPTPAEVCDSTWSLTQLVDVAGAHAYHDPLPGEARGPCPAQNALANHGYIDRSGYTNLEECVSANVQVFNFGVDFATYLCFTGQLTGGDLVGLTWSIGNSSAFDSSVKSSCSSSGLLGIVFNLGCGLSKVLGRMLGTPGFGMAQTHNSFEADSSVLNADWGTTHGLDASTPDLGAANMFWTKRKTDGTWDDLGIFTDWASYRMQQGISNNPCYFRAPQATLFAALGAYALVPRMFSNYTVDQPAGTLNSATLASFYGLLVDSNGKVTSRGFGKSQIPSNWCVVPKTTRHI